MPTEVITCWTILGLPLHGRGVTRRDIAIAFRTQALLVHPDKQHGGDDSEAFVRLHTAYEDALVLHRDHKIADEVDEAQSTVGVGDTGWRDIAWRSLGTGVRVLSAMATILQIPDAVVHVYGCCKARVSFGVDLTRRDPVSGRITLVNRTMIVRLPRRGGGSPYRLVGVGHDSAIIPGHRGDVVLHTCFVNSGENI